MKHPLAKEYWIFCDESRQAGPLYSNFFGGIIVPAQHHADIENRLRIAKAKIGFLHELKWQRVSEAWLEGYKQMMTAFFDVLRQGEARMRVMFRENNTDAGVALSADHHEVYFKLYYQFIKHAFGLQFMPVHPDGTRLRLFFDQFPHTREKALQFKGYLGGLPQSTHLRDAHVHISSDHIAEVDSKEHVLVQCVDIVTGAMAFRFNEMHLVRPAGKKVRGKRTLAKDRLYRHILAEIRTMKENFHPKISTAAEPFPEGRWSMPYRHWLFKSKGE